MHLRDPVCRALSEGGMQALAPSNCRTCPTCSPSPAPALDDGRRQYSLSPPHERALARALGLAGATAALPWAAWHAVTDGIAVRHDPRPGAC
jgi:hypothetical protein